MKKLTSLLLTLVITLAASAALPTFPKAMPVAKANANRVAIKKIPTPVVSNEADGVEMYAALINAFSNDRSLVKFSSTDPQNPEYFGFFQEQNYMSSLAAPRCGVFYNGQYYLVIVDLYTFEERPRSFSTTYLEYGGYFWDVRDMSGDWNNDPELNQYHYWYDMDYDYKNNRCYAIGLEDMYSGVSTLYDVNLEDGTFSKVRELSDYYKAFSVDYWGNLWGVRYKRGTEVIDGVEQEVNVGTLLSRINPRSGGVVEGSEIELTCEGKPLRSNSAQSMTFDHETGKLWWLSDDIETMQQYLYEVDVKTGEVVNHGLFGNYEQGVALYIPFTPGEDATAPSQVSKLTAQGGENGGASVTLNWVYPTTTWEGNELAAIKSAEIYRNGELIATLDCAGLVGQAGSYVDAEAWEDYVNQYDIVVTNGEDKRGVPASISLFVGKDYPGSVQNLSVALNPKGNGVNITWEKPVIGANGGWFDEDAITYTVVRHPDEVFVAEGLTECEFADNDLGYDSEYFYEVAAYESNLQSYGESVVSTTLRAGKPHPLPFNCEFLTEAEAACWSSVTLNTERGVVWEYQGGWSDYFSCMSIYGNYDKPLNDWLFSPKVELKAGVKYELHTVMTQYGRVDNYHDFRFTVGKGATPEAQTQEIAKYEFFQLEYDSQRIPYYDYFEVEEDGVYNIGVHAYSQPGTSDLMLQDFFLREMSDKDLNLKSLVAPYEIPNKSEGELKVTVANRGLVAQSNYSIVLTDMSDPEFPYVLAEYKDVPEIASLEEATFVLKFTPDVPVEELGQLTVQATLVFEGDLSEEDNVSELVSFSIIEEGATPLNVLIFDESSVAEATADPMNPVKAYASPQILYFPEDMNCSENLLIERIAFEYSGFPYDEFVEIEGVKADVYLANVNPDITGEGYVGFPGNDESYTCKYVYEGETTKVAEGVNLKFIKGIGLAELPFDAPFEYDYTKALYVKIDMVREGDYAGPSFPIHWVTYNDVYDEGIPFAYIRNNNGSTFSFRMKFKTYMAAKSKSSGVENVTNVAAELRYDATAGVLYFGGADVETVEIFDLAGRLCDAADVEGASQYAVDLNAGVYIVRVATGNGNVTSQKISVK